MARRYCPNCRQYVNGHKFSWIILILLLLIGILPGLIYGAIGIFRRQKCPMCGLPLKRSYQPPTGGSQE